MALTRRLLEGLGIEGKHVETIIEAHTETVNGLKDEAKRYRERAEMVPDLQKQLEEAKADHSLADLQAKYDERVAELESQAAQLKEAQDALAAANDDNTQLQATLKQLQEEEETLKATNGELDEKLAKALEEQKGIQSQYDEYKAGIEADKAKRAKAQAYRKQVLEAAGIASLYLDDVMGVTNLDGIELDEDGNIANVEEQVEAAKGKWGNFVTKQKVDPAEVDTPPAPKPTNGRDIDGANERAKRIARERHERLYGKPQQ